MRRARGRANGTVPGGMAAPGPRRWVIWLARVAVLMATLGLVTGVVLWRHDRYRRDLRFYDEAHSDAFLERDFAPLTERQVVQLGTAHNPENVPASSYRRFAPVAGPGTTRIGVFGCSFTRGAETVDGGDFPSQLEPALESAAIRPFDVVNFGVGGYGLQQSYLLWQYLGRDFDLDLVVFNLFDFHRQRDTTFVQLYDAYGPVHARYVLDGDRIRLEDVVGENRTQAADIYHRPLPPWRYLRYDVKPPSLLRSLLPAGRTLEVNPWYYHRHEGEIKKLYAAMLEDIRATSESMILICNDDQMCATLGRMDAVADTVRRIWTPFLSWSSESLYRAPKGHLSAAANGLVAREVAAIILGEPSETLPMASLRPAPVVYSGLRADEVPSLSDCREVFLGIGGEPAAVLVTRDSRAGQTNRFRFDRGRAEFLVDLAVDGEVRLIALADAPPPGAAVTVELGAGGHRRTIPVGTLTTVAPFLGRIDSTVPSWGPSAAVLSVSNGTIELRVTGDEAVGPAVLLVGGMPVLRSAGDGIGRDVEGTTVFRLQSVAGTTELGARAHPRQPPDLLERAREHGQMPTLDLVLVAPTARSTSVPLHRVDIAPVAVPPATIGESRE